MNLAKKKVSLVCCFAFIMVLLSTVMIASQNNMTASASSLSTDNLVFTQVTNSDGEASYKVAIKSTARPTVEFIVIPETYNGLPVTEIADNGFMSCAKLEKVIVPTSIKKVGNNAFMNCTKLERVGLPRVQSIGNSAFGMCASLDKLFIPDTVQSVGTTILRNNPNTVFIQSSSTSSGWQSTWNDYHTGEIVFDARPEATLTYQEILDDAANVIGYELTENQMLATEEDVVIYNSFKPEGTLEYKPLLNIRSEAFIFSTANSITIKDRNAGDSSIAASNHKVNIRSNAFLAAFVKEIKLEVGVTFNHPQDLQAEPLTSMFDYLPIVGDESGNSVRVFAESTAQSITLPADIDLISDKMFYNCAYLTNVKLVGAEYNGTNLLPNVTRIGATAFSSCVGLSNIAIPKSVTTVNELAFQSWGEGANVQTINVDFFKDELPAGWASNWAVEIQDKLTVNYKPLISVMLDLQDGNGSTESLNVKPDRPMPELEKPIRNGFTFKGFYSGINGTGLQYYTDEMKSSRNWNADDEPVLYANWIERAFTVTLKSGDTTISTVSVKFGDPMPAVNKPTRNGYQFYGFVHLKNGITSYYYNSNMGSAKNWDINEDATLYAAWDVITYNISYTNLSGGTNSSFNPTTYTIESDIITFADPIGKEGYEGRWVPSSIPACSTGHKTITAEWKLIDYPITYSNLLGGTNPSSNPTTYTIESEIITFAIPKRTGYTGIWNPLSIPKGSIGAKTITAVWTLEEYTIMYSNLLDGTNPTSNPTKYTIESNTITFADPISAGYKGKWDIPSIAKGSTGDKTITAEWTPYDYKIVYDTTQGNQLIPSFKDIKSGDKVGELPTPTWTGHAFLGWNTERYGTGKNITSETIFQEASNITIYAQWEYAIWFYNNGGTCDTSVIKGAYGTKFILPSISRTGYNTSGWKCEYEIIEINGNSVKQYTIIGDSDISISWTPIVYDASFVINDTNNTTIYDSPEIVHPELFTYNVEYHITAPKISGYTFQKWKYRSNKGGYLIWNYENYSTSETINIKNLISFNNTGFGGQNLIFTAVYAKNSCVAEGTLITLADGSQVPVELLTGNEQLLVWNLQTGRFDTAPMLFNDFDPLKDYEVINLYFSDGTTVKVISEHAFWDFTLNKYVFLRNDAAQYIGHSFNKQITDANGNLAWTSVQLTNVIVATEYTTAWSPVTESHLCFYVNGMLSMPGATEGLMNIFEVNAETMQYDQVALEADIAQYGLFTYEEFNKLIPLPEEMFDAFELKYMKVSIGKGYISIETLKALVKTYIGIFGTKHIIL